MRSLYHLTNTKMSFYLFISFLLPSILIYFQLIEKNHFR